MAYHHLYTRTYQWLRTTRGKTHRSWLSQTLLRPRLLAVMNMVLWCYQRSGLAYLLRVSQILAALGLAQREAWLPRLRLWPLPVARSAQATARGRIAVFTGCVGRYFEREAIEATASIATRAGYQVDFLPQQRCCGALAHHQGEVATSLALARANIQLFSRYDYDAILFLSSGCAMQLRHYADLDWQTPADKAAAQGFVNKLHETCDWIERHTEPSTQTTHNTRVVIHAPCSHRNVIGNTQAVEKLLRRITGITLEKLPAQGCCGGAGDYVVRNPILAAQVREPLLDAVVALQPQFLVTTNLGCCLSLAAGLRDQRQNITVLHPLTFYAQALTTPSPLGSRPG